MNKIGDDWPAARVFHLAGGVRAQNFDGPKIEFEPPTIAGKVCCITVKDYWSAFKFFGQCNPKLIGIDFYSSQSELAGKAPPDWRVFRHGRPASEQEHKWAEISHSGFKTKNGYAWDLSARISHQWRVCSWRVRQTSEAYAEQLGGCSKRDALRPGLRFEDGFTRLAYIAIQSYLVDVCILRDYLAEFIANIIFKDIQVSDSSRITTMSSLLKRVLPSIPKEHILYKPLEHSTARGGWLERLGHYRDLVVHTAPITAAQGHTYAVIEHVQFPEGQFMPYLRLPLPLNPHEIRAQRASKDYFDDFQAQLDSFTSSSLGKTPSIDGLDYIWETHTQMADFSSIVVGSSPIKGQMMTITETDIIGEIKIVHE